MTLVQTDIDVIYNPSSLLTIFGNTLNNETTRKVLRIKGTYAPGNGINYRGIYFDWLKDEAGEGSMTLVMPGLIRSQLAQSQTIECDVYLSKKVQLNGGRIDLQLNVVQLLSQNSSTYSEDQLKAFEILQKKAEKGHKDIDGFIKSKIINGEPITVIILIGKASIIDNDIKHQLKEVINFYKFHFIRINLTSEKEIIENLNYYHKKCDILAISRGGGENLEIFESAEIAEASLSLSSYFITAIGHKDNAPLLQKVADRPFITPTSLGQYFNEIYNNTVAELQNSKAKLAEDIKTQLEVNYKKQVENLNNNLASVEKANQRELNVLSQQLQTAKEEKTFHQKQIRELQQHVEKAGKVSVYTILFIIAALIIGCLLGKLL